MVVAWLSYACPGGWFSNLTPEALRPFVCKAAPELKWFDVARSGEARALVQAKGVGTRLYVCSRGGCAEIPVQWRTEATFWEKEE